MFIALKLSAKACQQFLNDVKIPLHVSPFSGGLFPDVCKISSILACHKNQNWVFSIVFCDRYETKMVQILVI